MNCKHCGTPIENPDSRQVYCDPPKKCRYNYYNRHVRHNPGAKREKDRSATIITILEDPDEFGFSVGAQFNDTETKVMLKDNCFTPGTKVNITGKKLRVEPGIYVVEQKTKRQQFAKVESAQ